MTRTARAIMANALRAVADCFAPDTGYIAELERRVSDPRNAQRLATAVSKQSRRAPR